MLYYRKSGSQWEAWTETYYGCSGVEKHPVSLKSPTVQAIVAYARSHSLTLEKR